MFVHFFSQMSYQPVLPDWPADWPPLLMHFLPLRNFDWRNWVTLSSHFSVFFPLDDEPQNKPLVPEQSFDNALRKFPVGLNKHLRLTNHKLYYFNLQGSHRGQHYIQHGLIDIQAGSFNLKHSLLRAKY